MSDSKEKSGKKPKITKVLWSYPEKEYVEDFRDMFQRVFTPHECLDAISVCGNMFVIADKFDDKEIQKKCINVIGKVLVGLPKNALKDAKESIKKQYGIDFVYVDAKHIPEKYKLNEGCGDLSDELGRKIVAEAAASEAGLH